MYVPGMNRWENQEHILAFMQRFSFATITNVTTSGLPLATHLPFVVQMRDNQLWLTAHFAKANEQWQLLEGQTSLVVFAEPHAYVSPSHYEKEQNVPTWNYQAVHAYGQARLLKEQSAANEVVEDLIRQSEPAYLAQWQGLSAGYKEAMFKGIVAFELEVTDLQAKSKLSQNKRMAEQKSIAEALTKSTDSGEQYLGSVMSEELKRTSE